MNNLHVLSKPSNDRRLDEWHDVVSMDHFWIKRRFDLIVNQFGDTFRQAQAIADVGCGRGLMPQELSRYFDKPVDGFELDQVALMKCPPMRGDKYVYNFFDYNETLKSKYDLLTLFDVLEHLEDDVSFLKALSWHLKPGGQLLINVPSNQMLFSRYDDAAGHFRRYNSVNLGSVLTESGFNVKAVCNWGYIYIPLLCIRKIASQIMTKDSIIENGFNTNPWTEGILKLWSAMDFTTNWNAPGTSLLLLATKK